MSPTRRSYLEGSGNADGDGDFEFYMKSRV